jgi:protein O-mannosyl-transferase
LEEGERTGDPGGGCIPAGILQVNSLTELTGFSTLWKRNTNRSFTTDHSSLYSMTAPLKSRKNDKRKKGRKTNQVSFFEKITAGPYAYLLLAVIILIIYWPALSFIPGKFDENLIINGNLEFLRNFTNLKQALLRDAFFSDKGVDFYRPVQNISFMIDAHLSGGEGWAYYLCNMIIHISTCFVLYYLLRLFHDRPRNAFLLTLVFAVNPLFVQAVAWAPSRGDLLVGLFGLVSLAAFIRYARSGKIKFLAIHLISFALAMFSKETAVLLPVAFLSFYLFVEKEHKTGIRGLIIPVVGYAAVIGSYLLLRGMVVKISATPQEFGIIPLVHNLRTIFEYPGKFFVPVALAPMPGYTLLNTSLGVAFFLLLGFVFYRDRKGNTLLVFAGLGWYFLFLLPGMMYSHEFGSAAYDYLEHRAYMPLAGIIFILFLISYSVGDRWSQDKLSAIILFLALGYAVTTRIYLMNYKNPVTFYNLAVRTNPSSAMAFNNRGILKYENQDYSGAINDYETALKIKPDYAEVYVNRGNCRSAVNDLSGALADFEMGIKYKNSLFQAHLNKANAMSRLGQMNESLKEYDIAINLNPSYSPGYQTRGETKYLLKDFPGALKDFTTAIELDKNNPSAYLDRGKANYMTGHKNEACADWQKAADAGSQEAGTLLQTYCR